MGRSYQPEVLAVRGNYGTPLASKSKGSVRATMDGGRCHSRGGPTHRAGR